MKLRWLWIYTRISGRVSRKDTKWSSFITFFLCTQSYTIRMILFVVKSCYLKNIDRLTSYKSNFNVGFYCMYAWNHIDIQNVEKMATEENKNRIVPSPEVTKSDFTIGFSVVDLVETRFGWWIFSWNVGFFRGWNLKSRVSCHKLSHQRWVRL